MNNLVSISRSTSSTTTLSSPATAPSSSVRLLPSNATIVQTIATGALATSSSSTQAAAMSFIEDQSSSQRPQKLEFICATDRVHIRNIYKNGAKEFRILALSVPIINYWILDLDHDLNKLMELSPGSQAVIEKTKKALQQFIVLNYLFKARLDGVGNAFFLKGSTDHIAGIRKLLAGLVGTAPELLDPLRELFSKLISVSKLLQSSSPLIVDILLGYRPFHGHLYEDLTPELGNFVVDAQRERQVGKKTALCEIVYRNLLQAGKSKDEISFNQLTISALLHYAQFIEQCFVEAGVESPLSEFIEKCKILEKINYAKTNPPIKSVKKALVSLVRKLREQKEKAETLINHDAPLVKKAPKAVDAEARMMKAIKTLYSAKMHLSLVEEFSNGLDMFFLTFYPKTFIPIANVSTRLKENVESIHEALVVGRENLMCKPAMSIPAFPVILNKIQIEHLKIIVRKVKQSIEQRFARFFNKSLEILRLEDRHRNTVLQTLQAPRLKDGNRKTMFQTFVSTPTTIDFLENINSSSLKPLMNEFREVLTYLTKSKASLQAKIQEFFNTLSIEERQASQTELVTFVEQLSLSLISYPLFFKFNELMVDCQACSVLNFQKQSVNLLLPQIWNFILVADPSALFGLPTIEVPQAVSSPATIPSASPKIAPAGEAKILDIAETKEVSSNIASPSVVASSTSTQNDTPATAPAWRAVYISSSSGSDSSTIHESKSPRNSESQDIPATNKPAVKKRPKVISEKERALRMKKRELLELLATHGVTISETRHGKGSHRALVRTEIDEEGKRREVYLAPMPMGSAAEALPRGTASAILKQMGISAG